MAYDPLRKFRPPWLHAAKQASALPPLEPEEEEGALESVGRGALGLAAWIGEALDKPGRAIRGTISGLTGGDWGGGLLNLIPFSDTLGVTPPEQQVTGRDLLEHFDVLPENKPGFASWGDAGGDVAGFGLEVLFDPTTYLTLGASAIGKAGKTAKAAGVLDRAAEITGKSVGKRQARMTTSLDELYQAADPLTRTKIEQAAQKYGGLTPELLGENLGSLGRFMGVPFGKNAVGAAETLDNIGEAIRFGKYSPVRRVASLLSPEAGGAVEAEVQKMNRAAQEAYEPVGAMVGERVAQFYKDLEGAGYGDDMAASNALRTVGELPAQHSAHKLKPLADQIKQLTDESLAAGKAVGSRMDELADDRIDYMARSAQDVSGGPGRRAQNAVEAGREKILKGFSSEKASQLGADPILSPRLRDLNDAKNRSPYVREKYLDYSNSKVRSSTPRFRSIGRMEQVIEDLDAQLALPKVHQDKKLIKALSKELKWHRGIIDQSERLAAYAASDPAQRSRRAAGVDLFGRHVLTDTEDKVRSQFRKAIYTDKLHEMLAKAAVVDPKLPGEDLDELIDMLGSTEHLLQANASGKVPAWGRLTEGAVDNLVDKLASEGKITPAMLRQLTRNPQTGAWEDKGKLLMNFRIPERIVKDLDRVYKAFERPDELRSFMNWWGKFTNTFKTLATAVRPNFHTRNAVSIAFMNWLIDARDPLRKGLMAWKQPYTDAKNLRHKGVIENASKIPLFAGRGLTDQQATWEIAKIAYGHGITGKTNFARELAPTALPPGKSTQQVSLDKMREQIPGEVEDSVLGALGDLRKVKGRLNPMRVKGGFHKPGDVLDMASPAETEDVFFLADVGRRVGNVVEDTGRLAPFIAFLKQGVDPTEAAKRVMDAHVDYTKLTRTERQIRNWVPFYTWMRRISPVILKEMLEKPGGAIRQHIRFGSTLRQDEGFLPDRLGGSAAIPWGGPDAEGEQHYITNIGDLPQETLNDLAQIGPGGIRKTGLGLLGMLNPLVKAPLEQFTGRQFFDDRDLRDKEGRLGRLLGSPKGVPQWAENLAANTPGINTLLTTAGTLTDTRKPAAQRAVNLLTGIRTATVDEKDRELALRELIEENLRGKAGVSTFESLYSTDPSLLSPEDQLLLRLNKTIILKRQKQARAEKKAGAGGV